MRALLQRVTRASVSVAGDEISAIDQGLLILLGVQRNDDEVLADKLLQKIFRYRLFSDDQQKMNWSIQDIQGGILIVSQFTLAADTQKGLRPGFSCAAEPKRAKDLYDYFVNQANVIATEHNNQIATGIFGADMQVSLVNDGPVTFLLEV